MSSGLASGGGVRPTRRAMVLTTGLLVVFLVYSLAPTWFLIVSATKDQTDLYSTFGLWFSNNHVVDNLEAISDYHDGVFFRWIGNSVLYSGLGAAGSTIVSLAAGYGLAKFDFRGRGAVFAVIVGASLLPSTLLAFPLYLVFAEMGITNTIWSVLIPYFINPFGVYLGKVYADSSVPTELMEAARIDGASEVRVFFSIALRLMRTGGITIFMLDFINIWNNFFLPLFMLNGERTFPVTLGLYSWLQQAQTARDMNTLVLTGSLLSIIPLAIFMFALQKYWRSGILMGSLK
ncbi:carbohydrate ABC transporter permease [Streptomyces ipomoeae]|jgi:multiple sugar transport system permease protein|uniref:ABC transporter, permease protein n=1 Tax=Streptomyces ipomoeae 91-03 TaxID=698759 RepID=L1KMZ8_9ACTN|nr:carbohydrate ABC transporter permease [Streptomyces ipomoeae]EKX61977.1 ABC transporter, permease protein [Streptomyces ipomoeae 91-03]MDX2697434.1 carbohydrate ABC transporter permease [Streptomyces ipomoeae]MDX2825462.1 carbohydrate ABC transporter permease [Streptomyces ipomoeae]MDX2843192.1 carbohydrate ABC transporter permease [Streptomyces ipomoeae]MDX2935973.1 carbohydrate ABC transporter permease [Streptomyces ipomoeae]